MDIFAVFRRGVGREAHGDELVPAGSSFSAQEYVFPFPYGEHDAGESVSVQMLEFEGRNSVESRHVRHVERVCRGFSANYDRVRTRDLQVATELLALVVQMRDGRSSHDNARSDKQ